MTVPPGTIWFMKSEFSAGIAEFADSTGDHHHLPALMITDGGRRVAVPMTLEDLQALQAILAALHIEATHRGTGQTP